MSKRPLHVRISAAISMLMSLIYTGGGFFLMASSFPLRFLPENSLERYAMAAILVLYGIYRGVRAWNQYNE